MFNPTHTSSENFFISVSITGHVADYTATLNMLDD